jgi:hypothetical protein
MATSTSSKNCLPLEHSSQSVMSSSSSNSSNHSGVGLAFRRSGSYLGPRAIVIRDPNHSAHQNLQRLRFLQSQMDSLESFKTTCKELISWCSDKRAFALEFAGQLNRTLQVSSFFKYWIK